MPTLVKAGETTALRRRVRFYLVAADGITPVTGEAGGQPEVSINDAAYTATGIGVLVEIGTGNYYAELTTGAVAAVGYIKTQYKSANTAYCPGTAVQVVAFDPNAATNLGLTDVTAIKAKTDNLPASPAAVGSAMTLAAGAIGAAAWAAAGLPEAALSDGAKDAIGEALLALILADNAAVAGSLGAALRRILAELAGKTISNGTTAAGTRDVYAEDGVTKWTQQFTELSGVFTRQDA